MCGVASIFAYHYASPEIDREELRRIRDFMSARGPDGAGEWYSEEERVGLAHRRLAIIDLSDKAAQPMQSENGALVISFNGEIYNYRELRTELEKRGRIFRSHSDTEVLLQLYADKGEAMVHDLRGMFAFVLWDARRKKMLLVRDPYGIKPLYYADDGWTVRVASQVKALLQSKKVSRLPDPAGIVGFFLTGSVPEPYTMYQEIRQVPAGSIVSINELGPSVSKPYFSIAKIFSDGHDEPSEESRQLIRQALLDSVRHHFVSDVPVAVFLSSGIDSGSLVSLAKETGTRDLKTITLAFEQFRGSENDESLLAEKISELYGTKHVTHWLAQEEFQNELPKIFELMDQPTIDGINTYFVSKAAAGLGVKVALSGLGGDELFGGYPSFEDIPRMVRLFGAPSRVPFLGDGFRYASRLGNFHNPKYEGLLKFGGTYPGAYFLSRGLFMPWELESVMDREMAIEGTRRFQLLKHIREAMEPDPKTSFGRVAALEASLYMRNQLLRDADWAGMAHSVEIRTPFVDAPLLRTLAPVLISNNGSKASLNKKNLLTASLKNPLPDSVISRAKTGFNIPIDKWLASDNNFDEWRQVPTLAKTNCPWARRWAYTVMEKQSDKLVCGF